MFVEVLRIVENKDIDIYLGLIDITIHIPKIFKYKKYRRINNQIKELMKKYFEEDIKGKKIIQGKNYTFFIKNFEQLSFMINKDDEETVFKVIELLKDLGYGNKMVLITDLNTQKFFEEELSSLDITYIN